MPTPSQHDELLASIRDRVIVSCQATPDGPLDDPGIIAALAASAADGGAAGFRIDGPANVRAVRAQSALPIIGIRKVDTPGFAVRITPTLADGLAVVEAGAQIVALDATVRPRPGGERLSDIVDGLHRVGATVMGDVATVAEGAYARDAGVDILACTLAGYTEETADLDPSGPALDVLAGLTAFGLPVIAEGRIWTIDDARACLQAGAWALVIGSAATAPDKITHHFTSALDLHR